MLFQKDQQVLNKHLSGAAARTGKEKIQKEKRIEEKDEKGIGMKPNKSKHWRFKIMNQKIERIKRLRMQEKEEVSINIK